MAKAQGNVAPFPAPIGGWNARDPLTAMDPKDALVLDNLIPDIREVRVRGGKVAFATGLGGPVESLMEYTDIQGGGSILAAAAGKVWNVSGGGLVGGSPLLTGKTSDRWQHVMFASPGGNFLCMVNGKDGYFTYNGAVFTDQTAAVTGVSLTNAAQITTHMGRLWFIKEGSTDVWYLPVQQITGAATKLPLGPFLLQGGSIIAMGSWTRDGGSGMDDFAVFVSNRGELLIYRGTDPASSDSWSFVGRFNIAEPIGHRCVVKAGADLAVLTSQGVLPLSGIMDMNESGQASVAFSDKIVGAYREAYAAGGTAFGWQLVEFPSQNLVVVNVPYEERGLTYQYVLNVKSGAWCRFTGLLAVCWSRYGSRLFFGSADGAVYEYDPSVHDDAGLPIASTHVSAAQELGSPGNKQFTMARPRFRAVDGTAPRVTIKLDLDDSPVSTESIAGIDSGAAWDEAFWDTAGWGATLTSSAFWQTIGGIATYGSLAFSISSTTPLSYEGADVMFKTGNLL